jgi:hypothetical protein
LIWKFSGNRIANGISAAFLMLVLLNGCAQIEYNTFRLPDINDKFRLPAMAAPVQVEPTKAITAEELIDAQGNCAGSPMASAAPATAETAGNDPVTLPSNPGLAVGGIGLGMSECDVVKRAGPPEKMTLGQNERSERTLVLTYLHNTRPGIYSFVAGRLATIERVDEPPPPPKPKAAKPKSKPKTRPSAT